MAKFTVNRESLEGGEVYPAGIYQFQMSGFKPKLTNPSPGKDRSTNLRPQMKITGHSQLDGKPIFAELNEKAGFVILDFTHALGLKMDNEDNDAVPAEIPGEFINWDPAKPEASSYAGPLLGRVGQVELAEVPAKKKNDKGEYEVVPNKFRNEIKRFICAVPGCQVKHRDNLIK